MELANDRPFLGLDNTYEKQRQCRMQDAIDDYLSDSKVDAQQAYEEMLSCVNDVIEYHRCNYEKAKDLRELMLGHRNPFHLREEWESYLAVCESLDFKPNAARFIRYNELYPYK